MSYSALKVREIVENAVSDTWSVPEFQRGFVWKTQVRDLAESLWLDYPIGNVLVKIVELMSGENRSGRIIRVDEVNDFGALVDFPGQRRQIVMPIFVRHGAIANAARFRQHLEAEECRVGG